MPTTKVKINVECENLASKSEAVCVLSEKSGNQWQERGRTELSRSTFHPNWKKKFDINYHFERRELLKFAVYTKDNVYLGGVEVTLATLVSAPGQVFEAAMTDGPSQEGRFIFTTKECSTKKVGKQSSFVDYIQNGTALNFSVAIDFTKSNGDPSEPGSLHYTGNPKGQNAYTQAIRAIGPILTEYDDDNQFPAFGFGALVPPNKQLSHDFFLNQHPTNPDCEGVEGIIKAYTNALKSVTLWGPTNFSPVIKHAAEIAKRHQDGRRYYILLIITDGVITDFEETKSAIVAASNLPLSIIIIGVGKANFSKMVALDSDDSLLQAQGRKAKRDIVQFVELRKFAKENGSWNKAALAQEVLAEVPNQVVDWMHKRGIEPVRN